MRIRQYSYFALRSETVSAVEIARRVGLQPDRTKTRGSQERDPPRPKHHSWEIVCDQTGMSVDDQIARILDRLRSRRDAIRELAEGSECAGTLQVVRYFHDDQGEEEELPSHPRGVVRLPGQHQLLGWHLARSVMEFLLYVGAELDIDEYG